MPGCGSRGSFGYVSARSKPCSFPVQKTCMPQEWRKQAPAPPSTSLLSSSAVPFDIAVVHDTDRFILKLPGLLLTYTVGPAANLLYGNGREEIQAVNESISGLCSGKLCE